MKTTTIVYFFSLSLLILAAMPGGAGQNMTSSLLENNTTMAEQSSIYSNEPAKVSFHTMELLGPWRVEFNSSEKLSNEEFNIDMGENEGVMGMKIEGMELWGMSLIDSMDHEIGVLSIFDLPRAAMMNDDELDDLIDSTLSGFEVDMSAKTAMDIDGTSGRRGMGFSSPFNRDIQGVAYRYDSNYDSFYNQNVTKSIIYYADLRDANEYNDVIESLQVERLY